MSDLCRYCSTPVAPSEATVTHSYWQGLPFTCHKACKEAGVKQEAFECQVLDADCNDCRHFRRGLLAPLLVSTLKRPDGAMSEVTHQPNVFSGHCLKFDKPTIAQPNKWSGLECFEHRRANEQAFFTPQKQFAISLAETKPLGFDCAMTTNETQIKKGDLIRIKPEWQDKGDSEFVWIAVSDEHPAIEWAPGKIKPASVDISHLPKTITAEHAAAMTPEQRLNARGFLSPWSSVDVSMLEPCAS